MADQIPVIGVFVGFSCIVGPTLYKHIKSKLFPPTLRSFTPTIPSSIPIDPLSTISPPTSIVSLPTLPIPSPFLVSPCSDILSLKFCYKTPPPHLLSSIVTFFLDCGNGKMRAGYGFIVSSEPSLTTFWGSSEFLYDQKLFSLGKFLYKGKISVSFMGGEHGSFEGKLVYVDYLYDLAVIQVQGIHLSSVEIARFGKFDGEVIHCLDYFADMNIYSVIPSRLNDASEDYDACRPLKHCNWACRSLTGICLNTRLEIVGVKTKECKHDSQFIHVLPVQIILNRLRLYNSLRCPEIRLQDRETRISHEFLVLHPECCESEEANSEDEAFQLISYENSSPERKESFGIGSLSNSESPDDTGSMELDLMMLRLPPCPNDTGGNALFSTIKMD